MTVDIKKIITYKTDLIGHRDSNLGSIHLERTGDIIRIETSPTTRITVDLRHWARILEFVEETN